MAASLAGWDFPNFGQPFKYFGCPMRLTVYDVVIETNDPYIPIFLRSPLLSVTLLLDVASANLAASLAL